jgi:hypothetical protein
VRKRRAPNDLVCGFGSTAANHIAKADTLYGLTSYGEATQHYQLALDRMNGRDDKVAAKLA